MPFQFVDDTIQAFVREHPAMLRALEQYYDEQNIMITKLIKISESEVEKKPSQAYQAFYMQLGQTIVQQQQRILSLVLTTATARVAERKQESIIAQVNPRDADIPQDMRSMLDGALKEHKK